MENNQELNRLSKYIVGAIVVKFKNSLFSVNDLKYGNIVETKNGAQWLYTGDLNALLNIRHKTTLKLTDELFKNWVSKVYKDSDKQIILYERYIPKLNFGEIVICNELRKAGFYYIKREDQYIYFLNGEDTIKTKFNGFNDLQSGEAYSIWELIKNGNLNYEEYINNLKNTYNLNKDKEVDFDDSCRVK